MFDDLSRTWFFPALCFSFPIFASHVVFVLMRTDNLKVSIKKILFPFCMLYIPESGIPMWFAEIFRRDDPKCFGIYFGFKKKGPSMTG